MSDIIDPRFTKLISAHVGHCPKGRKNRIRFLALALAGEAGEAANHSKKEWRGDDRRSKNPQLAALRRENKLADEIADVANYAFMLARVMGFDLPKRMLNKFIKVGKRPGFKHYGK